MDLMHRPESRETMTEGLELVREQLLASAFLFDDPQTYRAGVEDAFDALVGQLASDGQRATS